MCDYYGELLATHWARTHPKANKEHVCCACEGRIAPGSRYLRLGIIFEGSASTSKVCLPCEAIGLAFAAEHHATPHPDSLKEALQECVREEPETEAKWLPLIEEMRNRRVEADR